MRKQMKRENLKSEKTEILYKDNKNIEESQEPSKTKDTDNLFLKTAKQTNLSFNTQLNSQIR
jgi:hypothetical protein